MSEEEEDTPQAQPQAQPATARLTPDELQAVVQAARKEFEAYSNYGGNGPGPIVALLFAEFIAVLKEQNTLLADVLQHSIHLP